MNDIVRNNLALIGYARVSSVGQSLDVQLDKLGHCDKVFQEKKSGTSDKRPKLQACLEYVREGDVVVVTRLDRLARSTLHLCQIADQFESKKVHLQVIDQNINSICFLPLPSSRLSYERKDRRMVFKKPKSTV